MTPTLDLSQIIQIQEQLTQARLETRISKLIQCLLHKTYALELTLGRQLKLTTLSTPDSPLFQARALHRLSKSLQSLSSVAHKPPLSGKLVVILTLITSIHPLTDLQTTRVFMVRSFPALTSTSKCTNSTQTSQSGTRMTMRRESRSRLRCSQLSRPSKSLSFTSVTTFKMLSLDSKVCLTNLVSARQRSSLFMRARSKSPPVTWQEQHTFSRAVTSLIKSSSKIDKLYFCTASNSLLHQKWLVLAPKFSPANRASYLSNTNQLESRHMFPTVSRTCVMLCRNLILQEAALVQALLRAANLREAHRKVDRHQTFTMKLLALSRMRSISIPHTMDTCTLMALSMESLTLTHQAK